MKTATLDRIRDEFRHVFYDAANDRIILVCHRYRMMRSGSEGYIAGGGHGFGMIPFGTAVPHRKTRNWHFIGVI